MDEGAIRWAPDGVGCEAVPILGLCSDVRGIERVGDWNLWDNFDVLRISSKKKPSGNVVMQ